ncbi:hypothetical protein CP533_5979 [Ophiocordyceps camponoti-saundersi (nom. inval.)]|nr:hypothetical protein CP533_5979 [Ophiocordyceps camponoti-saundersi (nom. inval.)]
MVNLKIPHGALAYLLVAVTAQSIPASAGAIEARSPQDWQKTLSKDTRKRYDVAKEHLYDQSDSGQAFRHDTMMRVNIEREALDLPLIDLSQAFGMKLPVSRDSVTAKNFACVHKRSEAEEAREAAYTRSGAMAYPNKRSTAGEAREAIYLRSGAMAYPNKRSIAEEAREAMYLRSGTMTDPKKVKRSTAEEAREAMYLRSGTMTGDQKVKRSTAEEAREAMYLRSGTMTSVNKVKRDTAGEAREAVYLRGGTMTSPNKRSTAEEAREAMYLRSGTMTDNQKVKRSTTSKDQSDSGYNNLLDRQNLALGAIERINISRRIRGKPELTAQEAEKTASHGDEFVSDYWNSSIKHGGFWSTDQVEGKPNFVEGGQVNGFGFTQSTYHKLHCLANLRMLLAWHIDGKAEKMTRDIEVHAIHCLEYIRWRELAYPDLNEEPIDTVDYKGMGIH